MTDSPSPMPTAPRRRWLRFSLRTLLLAAPLAAILISYVGVRWYRSYVETQAVRAVGRYGGTVQRDEQGRIILVEIPGDKLTDEALSELVPHLANLPTLESLVLHGPHLTEKGLLLVRRLTQLRRLHLINLEVTPGALATLKKDRPGLEVAQSAISPTASALVARDIYDHALLHVAFSPDERLLVTGRATGRLELWEAKSGQVAWSVQAHAEWLFALAYHPQRPMVATAGGDNIVRLWNLASRKQVGELVGHEEDVHAVAFTPDGRRIVTAGDDRTVRIWDAETRKERHVLTGHTGTIPSLAISPDGRTIATASRDHTVRLWDVTTGRLLTILRGHRNDVMSVSYSPDGRLLASASYDKTVRIWDTATFRTTQTLTGPKDWVFTVRFSPSGQQLAAGSGDGVYLWHFDRSVPLRSWTDARLVSSLAFDQKGTRLAATSAEGTMHLWDVASGESLGKFGHGYRPAEPARRLAARN